MSNICSSTLILPFVSTLAMKSTNCHNLLDLLTLELNFGCYRPICFLPHNQFWAPFGLQIIFYAPWLIWKSGVVSHHWYGLFASNFVWWLLLICSFIPKTWSSWFLHFLRSPGLLIAFALILSPLTLSMFPIWSMSFLSCVFPLSMFTLSLMGISLNVVPWFCSGASFSSFAHVNFLLLFLCVASTIPVLHTSSLLAKIQYVLWVAFYLFSVLTIVSCYT